MRTRDDVEQRYHIADVLEKWKKGLIIAIGAITFIQTLGTLFVDLTLPTWANTSILTTVLLLTIAHSIVSFVCTKWFLFRGEMARLKQLLRDSLGVTLTTDQTTDYYNNPMPASLERLAAEVMENAFHSLDTLKHQISKDACVLIPIFLIWIWAAIGTQGNGLIVWAGVIIFSADILWSFVQALILYHRYENVYDNLIKLFTGIQHEGRLSEAHVWEQVLTYECAKSSAGLKLSSKIFFERNEIVSAKWKETQEDLRMPKIAERIRLEQREQSKCH